MTPQKFSRDFILCFFAQFVFSLAFSLLVPTLPIYLSRFGAKGAEIGFLIGIFSFSSLILRPVIGRALLNIPERSFMIFGTLLCVLSSVAYLLAPPFLPLLVVRIFHGIGMALFTTAIFTLVANIVPEMNRGQLISYFYLSFNMAFVLGPYFGMVLINRFSFLILFLTCTGLSLCSLLMALKLGKRKATSSGDQSLKIRSLLNRHALPSSIIAFMLNVIWGTLGAFFPLYALRHGVSNPGIFFVFLAGTLMLGRILGGKILDVYDRKKVIIPSLALVIMSSTVLVFSVSLPMFILVAVILGIGWTLLYPSLLIYTIEHSGASRGTAMSTFTGLGDFGAGVGPMIMGVILQWTSYPVMFCFLILTAVINFLYAYYAIEEKRDNVNQMMDGKTKER
jgi:predicted MFS family arabinose efflux permease